MNNLLICTLKRTQGLEVFDRLDFFILLRVVEFFLSWIIQIDWNKKG